MIAQQIAADTLKEEKNTFARRRWHYLVALLGIPIFFYLLPWFLIRMPSFEEWGGATGFGPLMDYGFHTGTVNADVVLYGDSAEALGINPVVLSQQLGLKVVALPNTIGSLRLTGEMQLQQYLKTNRPPRLIVLYLSPWNLDWTHKESKFLLYEGEEMMFRNGTRSEILAFFKSHTSDAFLFPLRYYQVGPKVTFLALIHHRHPVESAIATRGYYDPLFMIPPYLSHCKFPEELLQSTPSDSTRSFVQQYTTSQTKVFVYNAPIPGCTGAALLTQRSYSQVGAAPPKALSPTLFKGDQYFVHPEGSSVDQVTALLGNAIRERYHLSKNSDASSETDKSNQF